jgi:hypothetical protein
MCNCGPVEWPVDPIKETLCRFLHLCHHGYRSTRSTYNKIFPCFSMKDSAAPPVLIDASRFSLKGAVDTVRIYVRTDDIRRRFPGFALNQTWPVRATLIYSA